ncbi:MAG: hypothetical protein OHK0022_09840 [Roseiflexaceae bacterium]
MEWAKLLTQFLVQTGSRIAASFATKKINEIISSSPSKPKRSSKPKAEAEVIYHQRKLSRDDELLKIHQDLLKYREIEIQSNMSIAIDRATRDEKNLLISQQHIEVRKAELDIAKKRLEQDRLIAESQREILEQGLILRQRELDILEEEMLERRNLGILHLNLLNEHEANAIKLKMEELETSWDLKNWHGILSQLEIKRILLDGQKKHRLLMLVSPPEISKDCPTMFINNLQMKVQSELKGFIEQYYPLNEDLCPVEFYGKFFTDSVFDTEIRKLENVLSPVPTVVLYSTMTDENLYMHIRFWGLDGTDTLTIPAWNWEETKEQMMQQNISERESLRQIQNAIVIFHKIFASFIADVYYLYVNPLHEPRILQLEQELSHFGMDVYFEIMRDFRQKRADQYQHEIAIQAKEAAEEARRKAEELRQQQIAEELRWSQREEENRKRQLEEEKRQQQIKQEIRRKQLTNDDFFPICDVSLGTTTVQQLRSLGERTKSINTETGRIYNYYIIDGYSFWYDETRNIAEYIYVVHNQQMPYKWIKAGFNWNMSQVECIELTEHLGYTIDISHNKITAFKPEHPIIIVTLTFETKLIKGQTRDKLYSIQATVDWKKRDAIIKEHV